MDKPKCIAAIGVGSAAAFFAWYPISDGDIFWHLAAGREIIRTRAVPHADPFSFASQALPWIDLHWLFQAGMFGLQSLCGLNGVLAANSFFPALAAVLLFCVFVPARAALLSAPLWILGLFEVRYLAPHRPIMVSLGLLAAFLCCLELYAGRERPRYLAFLLPLQVLWTNSQPLFLLGPAIVLAWLMGEIAQAARRGGPEASAARRRIVPLASILVPLCLASLANPYGAEAFGLAFRLFARTRPSPDNPFSRLIDENRPLPALFGTPDAHYAWAALALTVCLGALMALRPRAVRLPLAFAASGMAYLAFRAERNNILYFFAALPLLGAQLPAAGAALAGRMPALRRLPGIPVGMALAFPAVLAVAVHAAMLARIRGSGPVSPFSFPDGSAAYLAAHPIEGNGFNADRYGGYLLWKGYPARKVFVDTRYALRPDSFLTEYSAMVEDPESFRRACDRYGMTYAVLPTALVTGYSRLSASLLDDPEWRLVYADGTEALFYRSGAAGEAGFDPGNPQVRDSLFREVRSRWASHPALRDEAEGYLARFLSDMAALRTRSP